MKKELDAIENYFLDRINEVHRMCNDGSPWVFLSACSLLDCISTMVYNKDATGPDYKNFINEYLSKVNNKYKKFRYKNNSEELAIQIYHVLRCGVVHNFSLLPTKKGESYGGRGRSIVLCHKNEALNKGLNHLSNCSVNGCADSCLFIAEYFVDDIHRLIKYIFNKARNDEELTGNIINRWREHTPIQGGFEANP